MSSIIDTHGFPTSPTGRSHSGIGNQENPPAECRYSENGMQVQTARHSPSVLRKE